MRWVEVVEVEAEAVAVVVPGAGADAGQGGWVVDRPPVPVARAFAPIAGTKRRTQLENRATRRCAPSAARRWCAGRSPASACS